MTIFNQRGPIRLGLGVVGSLLAVIGLFSCGSSAVKPVGPTSRSLEIAADQGKIVLRGQITEPAASAALQSAMESLAGPGNVTNELVVPEDPAKAPRVVDASALAFAVADVYMPWTIRYDANKAVALTGRVPTAKVRDDAAAELAKAFGGAHVQVHLPIIGLRPTTTANAKVTTTSSATEAIVHPIQFLYDGTNVTIRGDVADAATKASLVQQAQAAYGAEAVKDGLTVVAASPAKDLDFQTLFAGFPNVNAWVFTFGGKGVVIQGNIEDIAVRSKIAATLNTVLKGVPVDDQLAVFARPRVTTSTAAGSAPA